LDTLSVSSPAATATNDTETDDGAQWEWEPEAYIDVTFHMGKNDLSRRGKLNMATAVARVLDGRPENAALMLDGHGAANQVDLGVPVPTRHNGTGRNKVDLCPFHKNAP